MLSHLFPSYVVLEGPDRTFEASTLSSFREDRQRAKTDSPRGGGGGLGNENKKGYTNDRSKF